MDQQQNGQRQKGPKQRPHQSGRVKKMCFLRGMHICVFADKACVYNLICIGYTFCIDSLELCSQMCYIP